MAEFLVSLNFDGYQTTKRRALFFPDVLGKIKFMATFSTVLFLTSITFCHVESVVCSIQCDVTV